MNKFCVGMYKSDTHEFVMIAARNLTLEEAHVILADIAADYPFHYGVIR